MSTSLVTWNMRFMRLAVEAAQWSKDPDEGVGAVVVSADRRQFSFGYNGLPRGHPDDLATLGDHELKNALTIHAERNAVDNAPFDVRGATVYVTKPCCLECMKGLAQKGIKQVFYMGWRPESRWFKDQMRALDLAGQLGIGVAPINGPLIELDKVPGGDP